MNFGVRHRVCALWGLKCALISAPAASTGFAEQLGESLIPF